MHQRDVDINVNGNILRADLRVPTKTYALVLFAHGSGSGRLSPRNRFVAERLNEANVATLLLDLLTAEEEHIELHTRHLRFDIGLLTDRLSGATDWLKLEADLRGYPVGYFGASTGAAAALASSVRHPSVVQAVVSRGGRPDLAADTLARVTAPTLLIVGGLDSEVIDFNNKAMSKMRCETRLEIIPGATHLFEEAGKLEEVSQLAADWFTRYLCKGLA